MNTVFIISAPSGAGKTSLVRALLALDKELQASVSYTTRAIRSGEEEGKSYHFVSHDAFQKMIEQQAFLEHAKVFNHYYGTSHQEVEKILTKGKDAILEIDWQGAQQVRRLFKEVVGIFILPPSKQALRKRLEGRGQDKPTTIDQRMAQAERELSHYKEYDYLVVNEHFETAVNDMHTIIKAHRFSTPLQMSNQTALLKNLGLV